MEKQSSSWAAIQWPALFMATAALIGVQIALREDVQTSRPAVPPTSMNEQIGNQRVSARLWQDPLAAVTAVATTQPADADAHDPRVVQLQVADYQRNSGAVVQVIAVMLPSEPYAEATET